MSRSAPRLDVLLTELAENHATGALRVGRAGTVYLTDGLVTYADSATAPGPEQILTASGRVTAAALRRARQAAGEASEGALVLVKEGLVTLGELQFCVLGATLDAAFFLLSASVARPRFRDDDRHWLGAQWYFDVAGLIRECARRRTRLDNVWPSSALDTAPVVPVPRLNGQRVVLTAVQWEVLVHADATATPLELAQRLGRPAYATLLAVRQLAAEGLLRVPDAPGPPHLPRRADHPRAGPRPAARPAAKADFPQINGDPTDVELLTRLRDALEKLL